jgi:hypothetical protein
VRVKPAGPRDTLRGVGDVDDQVFGGGATDGHDGEEALASVPPLAPSPREPIYEAAIYDTATMQKIVWGPPPPQPEPPEETLEAAQPRQRIVGRRRRLMAGLVTFAIGAGALAEVIALTTRPVVARLEPLPTGVLTHAASPVEAPVAPALPAPVSAVGWSVAATPAAPEPTAPPSTPAISVTALPKVPAPVSIGAALPAAIAPRAIEPRLKRRPFAQAHAAAATPKQLHVPVEPSPVPTVDDPFVTAARRAVPPSAAPKAAVKPRIDDGF